MALKNEKRTDPIVALLLLLTAIMLVVRMIAAKTIGFGDSEALYATYALHPQPAYLDHPGLVGLFASSLGGGTIPSPQAAHVATAALATMFPWLVVIVARQMGAATRAAAAAGLIVAATPEIGVGLFAMTPDLLLAYGWLACLGVTAMALETKPDGPRAPALFGIAGVIAGAAATAKITGVFLLAALGVVAVAEARKRKNIWPVAAALSGLVPLVPVVRFEVAEHFPMLRHRLMDTQHGAGFSLRNIGALVGGQFVYVSPVILVVVVLVARDLIKRRNDDAMSKLLFWTFALPLPPLVVLCAWSRVAEPHWLAPPLLALPIHAARRASEWTLPRRLLDAAAVTGLLLVFAVHAWILQPSIVRTLAPASYDPRVDITNELFGWPQAVHTTQELMEEADAAAGVHLDTWVVGPSWMVCAQLAANAPLAKIGCATDARSDFDDWAPRARWEHADAIIFVTDDRMPMDPAKIAPNFFVERTERVSVLRGGRIMRTFRLSLLQKRILARHVVAPPHRGGRLCTTGGAG